MVVYTYYEAGLESEGWVVDNYLYELPLRAGEGIRSNPKSPGDFPEIYWISAQNFRGTVQLNGRKVHLYETDAPDTEIQDKGVARTTSATSAPADNQAQAKIPLHRAYIDADNRLPLMVDDDTTVWTYQFFDAPPAFPTPDARIQQIMKDAGATPALKSP